jgi:hypothetical protein
MDNNSPDFRRELPETPAENPIVNPGEKSTIVNKSGRRYLAYALLIVGAILTFFNGEIARTLSVPVLFVQLAAPVFFISGAILFFSVRETFDRNETYRQFLDRRARDLEAKDE